MTSETPIAIVAAMPEEIAPLVRRTHGTRRFGVAGRSGFRGTLGDRPVLFLVTGDGPALAREGVCALLDRFEVSAILGMGVAGGLTPDLEPGEVVVPNEIVSIPSSLQRKLA